MALTLAELSDTPVYLDTTTFYQFLRGHSADAVLLFDALENGRVMAYTSVLAFDEVTYRIVLALIRDRYAASPLNLLRQNTRQMLTEFFPKIEARLQMLQHFPNLTILPVEPNDLTAMRRNIQQYNLLPRDALHLAAMQKADCFHLVSQDNDFDHIPAITRYSLD